MSAKFCGRGFICHHSNQGWSRYVKGLLALLEKSLFGCSARVEGHDWHMVKQHQWHCRVSSSWNGHYSTGLARLARSGKPFAGVVDFFNVGTKERSAHLYQTCKSWSSTHACVCLFAYRSLWCLHEGSWETMDFGCRISPSAGSCTPTARVWTTWFLFVLHLPAFGHGKIVVGWRGTQL